MFELGFTKSDAVRAIWSFIAPFVVLFFAGISGIAASLATSCQQSCDWTSAKSATFALVGGLVSSALISLKNLVLKSGTTLKG